MNKIIKKWKVAARDEASPLIHALNYIEAAGTKLKKLIGVNDRSLLIDFHNAAWQYALLTGWTVKEGSWDKLGRLVLDQLMRDKIFLTRVYVETKRSVKNLISLSQQNKGANLLKFSNARLNQAFRKIYDSWLAVNMWGEIPNLADFEHFMLTNKIMSFLEERVKQVKGKISAGEAYSIIGTPSEHSYIQQSEIDFFKLLAVIQKDKKVTALFKLKNTYKIIQGLENIPNFKKAMARHTKKYDWLSYHYDGPTILNEPYFIELLSSAIRQKISGRQKLNKIFTDEKNIKYQQNSIQQRLKLRSEEKYWCRVARTFSYLKGLRKDAVFIASRNTDNLIREIGKRLNLAPKQVRHLIPREIRHGLLTGKVNTFLINQRINHCVAVCERQGIKLLTGKKAEKYAKMIYEEQADKNIKELKGTPAYPGKVQGTVKLIATAQEMSKMKQGNILVSPATNPNLVPAMKKAAAIITDEGGITCHAAIISRELGIPCIIGTKIATKVFKDGDRVEVDATKGIIKKI